MADRFTFTGQATLGYFSYANTDTGTMLVAEPGESYHIRATEEGLAVPPPDGRWVTAEPSLTAAEPSWPPPPAPDLEPPVTVPAEPEGVEA